jgi:hypothetical protein
LALRGNGANGRSGAQWTKAELIVYRIDDLELPIVHPKMAFITGALDKEIRLSFAQRIRGTLPDPYQGLITEGKEKDTPDFKYLSDSKWSYRE